MKTCSRWTCVVVMACLTCRTAPCLGAEDVQAAAAIRAAVAQWNAGRAAGRAGAAIVGKTFSDTAFVSIAPGDVNGAEVLDKARAVKRCGVMFEQQLAARLTYVTGTIHTAGTLAYELGEFTRTVGGKKQSFATMNFFAKEPSGWKLVIRLQAEPIRKVFATPAPDGGTGLSKADKAAVAFVRGVVDKLNDVLATKKGAAKWADKLVSDSAFAFLTPGGDHAYLAARADYLKTLTGWLAAQTHRKAKETLKSVAVAHAVVYAVSEFYEISADRTETRQEWLNVYAREKGGWKHVFATPADGVRAALAAAPAVAVAPVPVAPVPVSGDEKAIRRVALDFVDSIIKKGDSTKRLAELLTEDFVQVGSNGKVYKGRKANLAVYVEARQYIARNFKAFMMRYEIESVRVLGHGATVFGRINITGHTTDNQQFTKSVWETLALRKVGGKWQIFHEHSSPVPAGSERPAP